MGQVPPTFRSTGFSLLLSVWDLVLQHSSQVGHFFIISFPFFRALSFLGDTEKVLVEAGKI